MDYEKKDLQSMFLLIDKQHKDIRDSVKALYDACLNPDNKDLILELIYSLDKYVTEHFENEEQLAEATGFPYLEHLKKDHDYFKATYYRLRYHYTYYDEETRQYNHVYMFATHLAKTLEEWLEVHIRTLDKELIQYLKEKIF